jgi:quinoprotein dehydrogenase-associated probable ABC transporter substrate-binding protein
MPFSNNKKQGFENALANVIANDLKEQLVYVWQRMGEGFIRDYLNQSRCDLLIGIPTDFRAVSATKPYYRSTYVFLVRADSAFKPTRLDDPGLAVKRIGVQVLDKQYTPPGQALVRRGMQNSIRAFHSVGGDADSLIQAVLNKDVDVAVAWGPLAGYYARQSDENLEIIPIRPENDGLLPFTFQISIGVKRGNEQLRATLDDVLVRQKTEISRILHDYGVPSLAIKDTAGVE